MARKKKENNEAIYFDCTVSKVKSNKGFTIKSSKKDFTELAGDMEKLNADEYKYYIDCITDSIKYMLENELKNAYLYMSSKYPIKVVSDVLNVNNLVDITSGSDITLKFVNGYLNMVRVNSLYNPIDEF